MTKQQELQIPDLLRNFIMSSEMEGMTVDETIQAMCLAVLRGERTMEDCLRSIGQQYAGGN